jgi:cell wall-associated NlpC family hydrolase
VPTPAPQLRVGASAWVRVSVATAWRSPGSPRAVDAPALAYPVRVREWLAAMTYDQQAGLIGRADTQATLGDRVVITALSGIWAKVVIPNQPTPLDARGYPGWIPVRQLSPVAPTSSATVATVVTRTTWLLADDGTRILEASFATTLPVLATGSSTVRVALPGGGRGRLAVGAISVHARGTAALPATASSVLASARQFIGLRYLWAGTSGFGYDCSGLVHLVYRVHGITLPRDASPQSKVGTPISRSQLLPGDLGFFVRDGHVHHVAIWTGNGRILEAPDIGVPIREVLLSSLPYASEMTILRRVL